MPLQGGDLIQRLLYMGSLSVLVILEIVCKTLLIVNINTKKELRIFPI